MGFEIDKYKNDLCQHFGMLRVIVAFTTQKCTSFLRGLWSSYQIDVLRGPSLTLANYPTDTSCQLVRFSMILRTHDSSFGVRISRFFDAATLKRLKYRWPGLLWLKGDETRSPPFFQTNFYQFLNAKFLPKNVALRKIIENNYKSILKHKYI